MKEKRGFKNEVIRASKNNEATNRLNTFLSNKYVLPVIVILLDIVYFMLANYIVNTTVLLFASLSDGRGMQDGIFTLRNIWLDMELVRSSEMVRYIYIILIIVLAILDILFIYQVRTSLSDNINVNQKGDSRFATIEEIKGQYKQIPDRDKPFKGAGGTIISRWEDSLYIDTTPTNNLILGITRSGKGEFFVFPSIDVYSRAEEKASMIIADTKLELYRSAKRTLEARGYEVHVLNLIDPLSSMGYNPLTLIIKYYKDKRYDDAELMSDSFAFSIFTPNKADSSGNEKFFDETAAGVFSALILSHVEDCLKEDELLNQKRLKAYQEKRDRYDILLEEDEGVKDDICRQFKEQKEECDRNGEDVFLSSDVECIPDSEKFYFVNRYEKCINVYSILNTLIELSQEKVIGTDDTALDEFFRVRPPLDAGKMRYASALVAGDRTKGSILANTTQGLRSFTSRAIARMTAESTFDITKIGFGEKPVAIFMGIPDYDKSKHFIPVTFISQVYYYLAETCSRTIGRCKRHVKFLIDEFGNMPPINDMDNNVTVCLGRNISFDLYVQDYAQLSTLYGDGATTIKSNCANHIWILSNDLESAKEFSEKLNNKTIINLQRTGPKLSLSKHFMEQPEEKPILSPTQLMRLKEGECVILRAMKRKDNKGRDITSYPIFNSIETGTRLKYRYQYLTATFPNPNEISLDDVVDESCRHINPKERIWDFNFSFARNDAEAEPDEIIYLNDDPVLMKKVFSILEEQLGEKLDRYGIPIDGDIAVSKLIDLINRCNSIDKFRKVALLGLLSGNEG